MAIPSSIMDAFAPVQLTKNFAKNVEKHLRTVQSNRLFNGTSGGVTQPEPLPVEKPVKRKVDFNVTPIE